MAFTSIEQRREYDRKWYAKNRETLLAKALKRYHQRSAVICAQRRQAYKENPATEIERSKAWNRSNPEQHNRNQVASRRRKFTCSPTTVIVRQAKARAKRRSLEFSITEADVVLPSRCPVFGTELVYAIGGSRELGPALDRIDNTKGYIPGNVIIVSGRANRIKSDASFVELQQLAAFYGE